MDMCCTLIRIFKKCLGKFVPKWDKFLENLNWNDDIYLKQIFLLNSLSKRYVRQIESPKTQPFKLCIPVMVMADIPAKKNLVSPVDMCYINLP